MRAIIRVIHLPKFVGNNSYFLSLSEKKLIFSKTLSIDSRTIYSTYKADFQSYSKYKVIKYFNTLILYLLILMKYNIIHFNYGMTLTATHSSLFFRFRMNFELSILKLLRKKIVVTFQGSDARQADYCKENYKYTYFNHPYFKKRYNKKEDINKRYKIAIFDKYADLIYTTNPDLKNVLPDRTIFRPYTKLDFRLIKPVYKEYNTVRPIVIVHAPSRRYIKGTEIIETAIRQLIIEGFLIDFQLIENMVNSRAFEIYKKADLVIDQLYVGWYGGFSVEAMALGKPVMCYIRQSDLKHIPSAMKKEMPIIKTNPVTFYSDLKYILLNRDRLKKISINSRNYIQKWHDNDKIAKVIVKDYKTIMKGKVK